MFVVDCIDYYVGLAEFDVDYWYDVCVGVYLFCVCDVVNVVFDCVEGILVIC